MSGNGGSATNVAGTPLPTVPLSDENEAWLQGRAVDLDRLVTVERLRHEQPDLVRSVHEIAAEGGTRARILRFLALQGESATCGYDELTAVVDIARRTVRYHAEALDEAGLVDRTSLGPSTAVEFTSAEAYVIASDILGLYER